MKKAICLLLSSVIVLLTSVSLAASSNLFDTISQYSTDELLQLRQLIDDELEKRNVFCDEETSLPTYILNTNTRRFHLPSCKSVGSMKVKNRADFYGARDDAIDNGYKPCGECHP